MYAQGYAFNQGAPAPSPGYNPNNGVPASAHPPEHHQQPQPQHHHQQQQQQQQQHMMYNPQQQYGASIPHPSPYGAPPQQSNQSMPSNMPMPANMNGAGPMMQNGGMAHMAGNNNIVPPYQTPYSASPYAQGMPPSSGAPHQQAYMPQAGHAPQFAMPPQSMTPQPHQRMQPPQRVGTPVNPSQRVSPYGGPSHNTPPHAQQPSQFMTPQAPNSNQHTPHSQPSVPSQGHPQGQQQAQQQIQQPQPKTPSYLANTGNTGANTASAPLSPVSEGREKERVTLLLDINRELLLEVMRIQASQAETKKEPGNPDEKPEGEKAKAEKQPPKEYFECMRRLQYNLAYLAAIADKAHKPASQIPPHPAIISAPPLQPLAKSSPGAKADKLKEETNASPSNGEETKEDRADILKALYLQLQALFPGVDPKKEPPLAAAMKAKSTSQPPNTAQTQAQKALGQQMGNMTPGSQAQGGMTSGGSVTPQMQAQMQARHQQQMMMMAQQQQQNNPNMSMGVGNGMGGHVPMSMNANMGMNGGNAAGPNGQMMMPGMGMGGMAMPMGGQMQGQGPR